jgi:hypothetical protein
MKYRKPRSFNSVSVLLLVCFALAGYVLVYLWPVYSASAKVRSLLREHIPTLYRANLMPDQTAIPIIEKMKDDLLVQITKQGIDPKTFKLEITRDSQQISLQGHFKAKAHFPLPDRTFEFNLSPKVQSDAARVEWE